MDERDGETMISLREANQAVARLVRAVEAGASFTITRHGAPVARLTPIADSPRRLTPDQEAALERTCARMADGWPIGAGSLDRDAAHER